MAVRNQWRVGDYLMTDDLSGRVHYASEMRKTWDGLWVHRDNFYTRNPQDFVRAMNDPEALREVRGDQWPVRTFDQFRLLVGSTQVRTPIGAGYHLTDVGVGTAVVGFSFVVR